MSSQTPVLRFSLSDVAESEQDTAVREVVGRAVMNMDIEPLTEERQFQLECQFLPGAVLLWGLNSPHRNTSAYDPSRENDDLALVWGTTGGLMSQSGKEIRSDVGPALISCAEPLCATSGRTIEYGTIRIERSLLLSVLPEAEALVMNRQVAHGEEPFRLLEGYLSLLRAMPPADADLGHAAAVHICDLIALMFGTNADCENVANGRGLRAARLGMIKRWTVAHLADASLNVASAAAAHQLSPRYVQILFAEAGTTFSAFVLNRRLRLVHRCLRSRKLASRPISMFAYSAGFSDLSYFNRSFRTAFGEAPSDVRARAWEAGECSL